MSLERTLHRDYYVTDAMFARERERIFFRECLMLSLSADHAAAFALRPEAPARTTVACEFLFHADEVARPGFDPSDVVEFWDRVNRQDWAICESVQRGMGSRVFRSGYYAPMESWSLDIRRYVGERLGLRQEELCEPPK